MYSKTDEDYEYVTMGKSFERFVPGHQFTICNLKYCDGSHPCFNSGFPFHPLNMHRDGLEVKCNVVLLKKATINRAPSTPSAPISECASSLNNHLGSLLQSGLLSDATVTVAGRRFPVHKSILAARSPVFSAMFQCPLQESANNQVYIDDIEADVFAALLNFIYTDKLPDFDSVDSSQLIIAADKVIEPVQPRTPITESILFVAV